jgi:hypothetical protein
VRFWFRLPRTNAAFLFAVVVTECVLGACNRSVYSSLKQLEFAPCAAAASALEKTVAEGKLNAAGVLAIITRKNQHNILFL